MSSINFFGGHCPSTLGDFQWPISSPLFCRFSSLCQEERYIDSCLNPLFSRDSAGSTDRSPTFIDRSPSGGSRNHSSGVSISVWLPPWRRSLFIVDLSGGHVSRPFAAPFFRSPMAVELPWTLKALLSCSTLRINSSPPSPCFPCASLPGGPGSILG